MIKKIIMTTVLITVVIVGICIYLNSKHAILGNLFVLFGNYETIEINSAEHQALLDTIEQKTVTEISKSKTYMVVNKDDNATSKKMSNPRSPMLWGVKEASDLKTVEMTFNYDRSTDLPTVICSDTKKEAKQIELFTLTRDMMVLGGGYTRTAHVCDSEYIIQQWRDPMLTMWSGPYTN